MATEFEKRVTESVSYLKNKITIDPQIAIILGSGLGGFADELQQKSVIPYAQIPHFPTSTAPGHKGQLVVGTLRDTPVLCMQGRFHFYEGYAMNEVAYPISVLKCLGIKKLLITNSCGGIDTQLVPGDLMLIEDHINFMGRNPLIGPNEDSFGVRFPDMSYAYDLELRASIVHSANRTGIELKKGVYLADTGPSYETPAEIRMFRGFGASAVGMSTVPEVIAANHCGIRVAAISCITNMAAGILSAPLSSEEVIEVAARAGKKFTSLLRAVIEDMA